MIDTIGPERIKFCWIPAHIGIKGNEIADQAAQNAQNSPLINIRIPHSDYKSKVKHLTHQKWKQIWTELNHNKLREVQDTTNLCENINSLSRKDAIVIIRLRIGHTHLTHGHLMCREEAPVCTCQEMLTIKHIFTSCTHHKADRDLFKLQGNLNEILKIENASSIIKFLEKINLLTQI